VHTTLRSGLRWALVAAAALVAALAWTGLAAATPSAGNAYTQTNDPAGNRVQVFLRAPDGALTAARSFPTGGQGTGGGLGNQGAVVRSGRWLLAVNAGSDELSLFRARRHGLVLTDVVGSGGDMPVSVTTDGRRAYVLNAGAGNNLTGFTITHDGRLQAIPGSTQPLSAAMAAAAQIELAPAGGTLVVTEKDTNRIVTYPVAKNGSVGAGTATASAGQTPFGFAFDRLGRLFVSEAFGGMPGMSAVSSYGLVAAGGVTPISPAVGTLQTAACWVVLSRDQRFAYATNTDSDSITGYRIAKDGSITRLDQDGVTAPTGDGPTDLAIDASGRTLYALNAAEGSIGAFRVGVDGGLTPLASVGGLPAGAVTGLAVQ
jgi:6-phosphogluconolactonase